MIEYEFKDRVVNHIDFRISIHEIDMEKVDIWFELNFVNAHEINETMLITYR